MASRSRTFFSLLVLTAFSLTLPSFVLGQGIIPPECTTGDAAGCNNIGAFLDVGVRIYDYLLGIVGSVALAIFMYGGVVWLTSGGNSQRLEHGKKVFEGALAGLALIFGSWLIINFVVASLTGTGLGQATRLFPGAKEERPPLTLPGN